jgi:AraC-like DNA-binding protein
VHGSRAVEGPGPGGQTYTERPPLPALAGLVSSVWIQQVAPDAPPYTHRNIPNGGVELLCRVGAMPRVVGPLTRPLVEVLTPGATVVGMRFHPGAAPSVLGLPASALVDLTLEMDELWGSSGLALGEMVDAAGSPEEALTALQRRVAGRLADAAAPDPLVSEAVRQLRWRTEDVGALTASLYISERQLRRRCQAAVGVAPKVLHRMLRFQGFLALAQHAIAQGKTPTDDGLALLAAEAGYADQPHLSRECLRLTGVSPRAFLGETAHACGCGHDHAASYTPLLRSRPSLNGGSALL